VVLRRSVSASARPPPSQAIAAKVKRRKRGVTVEAQCLCQRPPSAFLDYKLDVIPREIQFNQGFRQEASRL
jgi:hypothetical protein